MVPGWRLRWPQTRFPSSPFVFNPTSEADMIQTRSTHYTWGVQGSQKHSWWPACLSSSLYKSWFCLLVPRALPPKREKPCGQALMKWALLPWTLFEVISTQAYAYPSCLGAQSPWDAPPSESAPIRHHLMAPPIWLCVQDSTMHGNSPRDYSWLFFFFPSSK